MLPSTGSAGDCFDNAMAESFFATLIVRLEPSPVLPGAASRGYPIYIYRIGRRLYVHRLSPTAGLVATAQTRPLKRGKSSLMTLGYNFKRVMNVLGEASFTEHCLQKQRLGANGV